MTPPLPRELIDHIIDQVDMLPVLPVTSLVAKSWLGRSQARIYEDINMLTPTRLRSFETLINDSRHLAPYIKGLKIGHLTPDITGPAATVSDYESPTAFLDMKNLQRITVQGISIVEERGNIYETTIYHFLAQFPSLTSLHFTQCDIHCSILPPLITTALKLSELAILECSACGDQESDKESEALVDGGREDEGSKRARGARASELEEEGIDGIRGQAQGE